MSFSAHRPGRLDSQGRISFGVDGSAEGENTIDDELLDFVREFEPDATGSRPAQASTAPTEAVTAQGQANIPHVPTFGRDIQAPQAQSAPVPTPPVVPEPQPVASAPAPTLHPRAPRAPRVPRERRERAPGSRLRQLAILGGASGPILDRVPIETSRFVQMFFVLLGTAVVSGLSMLFALTTGVQVVVWLAVPLSIVWALLIFNLDRFLTSTMKSTRSAWKLTGLAIPRVIMAMIIGFVVAEPLVLQAFHNDIAREVASTNITQSLSDQEALETGPERKALDAATARVATLETQAATGIVAGAEGASASQSAAKSTVDQLTAQMAEQQLVIDQARALYQCELTGEGVGTVPGCTGVSGEGASSGAAEAQLAQAQQTYDGLAAQLRDANDQLSAADTAAKDATSASEAQNREQAKAQLPQAQATYEQALAAYEARSAAVAGTNADAIGLLSQIGALNRLAEKEPTILWAHLLIAALFFMIELLPVIVKVLTSWGEPSLYEKAERITTQTESDRITAQGFRDRADIVAAGATAVERASAVEPVSTVEQAAAVEQDPTDEERTSEPEPVGARA